MTGIQIWKIKNIFYVLILLFPESEQSIMSASIGSRKRGSTGSENNAEISKPSKKLHSEASKYDKKHTSKANKHSKKHDRKAVTKYISLMIFFWFIILIVFTEKQIERGSNGLFTCGNSTI